MSEGGRRALGLVAVDDARLSAAGAIAKRPEVFVVGPLDVSSTEGVAGGRRGGELAVAVHTAYALAVLEDKEFDSRGQDSHGGRDDREKEDGALELHCGGRDGLGFELKGRLVMLFAVEQVDPFPTRWILVALITQSPSPETIS